MEGKEQIKVDKIKAIIILSGGMDSTTLLYDIIAQGFMPYALSFNYGQRHFRELDVAKKTCDKLKVNHIIADISSINKLIGNNALTGDIDVPEGHYKDENMKVTVVPNRNAILLNLAIAYAISIGSEHVYYGAHIGDHSVYPDCRKVFVKAMQKVASLCHYYKIHLHAPYLEFSKSDIVRFGQDFGVDYLLTHTCYKGNMKACGKCGSCIERLEAFEKVGIKDPIEYET